MVDRERMTAGERARADRLDAYSETIARLEPEIAMIDHDAGIASIAISLKRIADVLEKISGVVDVVQKLAEDAAKERG